MKPISRLRTRARSEAGRSATGRPFSTYVAARVGVSSSPRIESSVDLPQPDGPAIDTYSPLPISRWTSESACVSTSSVRNTLSTDFSWITGGVGLMSLDLSSSSFHTEMWGPPSGGTNPAKAGSHR